MNMMENNKFKVEDIYPMSDIEKGMVFHYLNSDDVILYHNQTTHQIKIKDFDSNIMKRSLELMIEKHDILRTSYNISNKEFLHIIYDKITPNYQYHDISMHNKKKQEDMILDFLKNDSVNKFDLNNPSLWRLSIFKIDDDYIYIAYTCHHAILDGWSSSLFFIELNKIYFELKNNLEYTPKKLKNNYKESVVQQLIQNRKKENIDYWNKELEGFKKISLNESGDYTAKPRKFLRYNLGYELLDKLQKTAVEYGTSVKNLCFSAYFYTLNMLTYENDLTVGILTHCRPICEDSEKILGCFLNTIPFRLKLDNDLTWSNYIKLIDKKLLYNKAYEKMSLIEISKNINEKQEINTEIVNTLFSFQDFFMTNELSEDKNYIIDKRILIKEYEVPHTNTNTLLDIIVNVTANNFLVTFSIVDSINNYGIEEKLIHYFKTALNNIIYNPEYRISKQEMLVQEEKENVLWNFNKTEAAYCKNKTIDVAFEEQAQKTPDNIALTCNNKKLTYRELNRRVNSLTSYIIERGVEPNCIVALKFEPSIEMIVAMLAVLKSGATFLPIDNNLPEERIKYMLQDSKVNVILTNSNLSKVKSDNIKIILVDSDSIYLKEYDKQKIQKCGNSAAYVIYTSGTTGKPKGVLIKHSSILNYVEWFLNKSSLLAKDKTILTSSFAFDLGYTSVFTSLLNGCELHLVEDKIYKDPELFLKYIKEKNISYLKMTPSLLSTISNEKKFNSEYCKTIRLLVLGGEKINIEDVGKIKENFKDICVMNHYGPTETTIGCIAHLIDFHKFDEYKITHCIGKPISNNRVYILDKDLNVLPIGIEGEICIAGDGLAIGYLNNEEEQSKKFILNLPFGQERIYRTGDLGKWLPNGEISFLGRIDDQVKIRGYRVEPKEVEKCIFKINGVKNAYVNYYEDKNKVKNLCAYFVSDNLTDIDIRNYLVNLLPDYMIPIKIVKVDRLELTANGKVDSRRLKEFSPDNVSSNIKLDFDEIEIKVLKIWGEVLGLKITEINFETNFLYVGGHSLSAIKLISSIYKEFGIRISLVEFFKKPTIRDMVNMIKNKMSEHYNTIEIAKQKEYYKVSSAQKRLYILQQLNKNEINYNQPRIIKMEGLIDLERLEYTFVNLINRHESLRTNFQFINGECFQEIKEKFDFKVEKFIATKDKVDDIFRKFIRPFNLEKDTLIRVGVIKISAELNFLLIDTHHIVSDATSLGLFIKEFLSLYKGDELRKLRLQYKDYSEWHNSQRDIEERKKEEKYWLDLYKQDIPILNLPLDFKRPSVQNFEGNNINFKFDKAKTKLIKDMAMNNGVSVYSILISAFNILLSNLSCQEDIIVGTPVVGRHHQDLENIMGMFSNTLALRNYPTSDKIIKDFIDEVGMNTLNALEHQDYPFEELVENVKIPKDISRNPIFDAFFAFQKLYIEAISINGIEFIPCEYKSGVTKFDLSLYCVECHETLSFSMEYCTKLFKETTIELFIGYFNKIIDFMIINLDKKIGEIDILSDEISKKILVDFNDTAYNFRKYSNIQSLFEEQAEKKNQNVAIFYEDELITYKELNEKANQMARKLRQKNVKPNEPIGIMVERSVEMIIGILAILKAGAAYVPIDIELPKSRVDFIIADSNIKVMITKKSFYEKYYFDCETMYLEDSKLYTGDSTNLENLNKPEDIAYILYTSGTTGEPKGVMVEHNSVINILSSMQRRYPIMENERYLFKTSYAFDVSIMEIFGCFVCGESVVILGQNKEKDPIEICNSIKKYNVTHVNFAPSMFNLFLDILSTKDIEKLSTLKYIFLAGEELTINIVKKYYEKGIGAKLENLYGPTEATVYTTAYSLDKWGGENRIPIGKPLDNIKIYILSEKMRISPISVCGELCISGEGVSRGYLNNKDYTEEKFIKDCPYTGETLYRTGDLVKWLPDGNIQYIGRLDKQVKIRGLRIELGDIENQLIKYQYIKDVAVILKNHFDKQYLCAYIVSKEKISLNNLKEFLRERLPYYMIPTEFIKVDEIPTNSSGKVDYEVLSNSGVKIVEQRDLVSASNELEEIIAGVWSEVLNLEIVDIDVNANFFDLGGTSLDIIKVSKKLSDGLNTEIDVVSLFQYPTVYLISKHLELSYTRDGNDLMNEKDDLIYSEAINMMEEFLEKVGD